MCVERGRVSLGELTASVWLPATPRRHCDHAALLASEPPGGGAARSFALSAALSGRSRAWSVEAPGPGVWHRPAVDAESYPAGTTPSRRASSQQIARPGPGS